jgi:hypothetical protein
MKIEHLENIKWLQVLGLSTRAKTLLEEDKRNKALTSLIEVATQFREAEKHGGINYLINYFKENEQKKQQNLFQNVNYRN